MALSLDVKFEVQGYKELSKKYGERSKAIKKVSQRIISKVALTVERFAKIYSPVKTGRMRASIIPVDIDQMSAKVGPQVEYARYVHKRIPFMYAARQDTLPEVQGIVRGEVRKAMK